MKNKIYKILIFIFYLLSLFIFLFCLKIRLNSGVYLYTRIRIILLILACLFIYLSGYMLVKKLNYSEKILNVHLIIYFIVYTITLITLTLFDEIFGRHGLVIVNWNKELLDSYLKFSFNIIPFDTIKLYIKGYINGYVGLKVFSINIFGNLVVLMPYGIFIPLIFKKINKYYKFLILIIILVLGIELLQFITLSGSCDIDDLILNVIGASIIYYIYQIKVVKRLFNKIFLFK